MKNFILLIILLNTMSLAIPNVFDTIAYGAQSIHPGYNKKVLVIGQVISFDQTNVILKVGDQERTLPRKAIHPKFEVKEGRIIAFRLPMRYLFKNFPKDPANGSTADRMPSGGK